MMYEAQEGEILGTIVCWVPVQVTYLSSLKTKVIQQAEANAAPATCFDQYLSLDALLYSPPTSQSVLHFEPKRGNTMRGID
jgi:hypothetical protein